MTRAQAPTIPFVDRQRELAALDRFYAGGTPALLILYGRRRVGKTLLLSHWLEARKIPRALFWTATTHGPAYQLRDFSQALMQFDPRFTAAPSEDFSFRSWEAALDHAAEIAGLAPEPLVLIIDEFTHLIQSDPPLASVLQKAWDHRLSKVPNLRLILTGSLVGLIEREVLSAQAPLYGRATMLLRLRPLPFGTLQELFPRWPVAERVAAYAVCGGIPAYLGLFARANRFVDGLRDSCLTTGSIMLTDSALLLTDQLREPYLYESVLRAIASGYHTWKEIARMAGITESSLGHYMQTLQALELAERRDPVLSEAGARRGRYYVRDAFLRFYYRFIVPHVTAIERGDLSRATQAIAGDLRAFIGTYVFEDLCREWVAVESQTGRLGFSAEDIGSYWAQTRAQSVQLDVVAASRREKRLFIGEAKWGTDALARTVLTDLVERSQRMPQVKEGGWQVQYGLFARAGFTKAAREAARQIGAQLVDLTQLERTLVTVAQQPPDSPVGAIEF